MTSMPKPRFKLVDNVVVVGGYASDWAHVDLFIGSVFYDRKRNRITYGVYEQNCNPEFGITDEFSEHDLSFVAAMTKGDGE